MVRGEILLNQILMKVSRNSFLGPAEEDQVISNRLLVWVMGLLE